MQHDTVVIARKRWYCITMGWSRLLLVKRKRRIKTTKTNNNMGFRSWLESTHADDVVHNGWNFEDHWQPLWRRNARTKQIHENGSCTFTGCVMELFGVYIKFLRGGNGNLSTFWLSYMDMTDILLGLIRSSREGEWMLHMASVRAMIPWCVACDRLNYARSLPCYCAHMSQLPTPHPDMHAEFMQGWFSVQLSSNNPFGRIPVDHTIEEPVNKMNMMGQCISKPPHPDLQDTRTRKDETDIKSLIVMLENNWLNP